MKPTAAFSSASILILCAVIVMLGVHGHAQHQQVSASDVEMWMSSLSNWGRWGPDDQRGTLNLITPQKRRAAATLVREGTVVSLAHEVLTEKDADNPNPFIREMVPTSGTFRMDRYSVAYHGMSITHIDALCHASYKGQSYNGVPVSSVTADGCERNSVSTMKDGLFTRGVLIDMAWLKGVEFLEPGTPIYPADLQAWEQRTGITVSPGDALFVRTGRWRRRALRGPTTRYAGFHASVAPWLHDRGVAVLGGDADPEVAPSTVDGIGVPIHQMALVAMGLPLIDNCDFEELAVQARALGRWTFLFTTAPLKVRTGTGSPINPIAVF